MACKLTLSVLSEHQEGEIGDDWKYEIEAKLFCGGLKDDGTIAVSKHHLGSGETRELDDGEAELVLTGVEAGSECRLDLKLTASEVDILRNDVGTASRSITLSCPPQGESITRIEEISAGVTEAPANISTSVFTLKLQIRLDA